MRKPKHEVMVENGDATRAPTHGPHCAGNREGTCNRFPDESYVDDGALGGMNNLEVPGEMPFIHVRCPRASTAPCTCGRLSLHVDSLIVAVDGACPGNGSLRAAKSACGVYFGPGSPVNLAFRVPDTPGDLHTNQRAELSAAIAAVMVARRFVYDGGHSCCDSCPKPCTVTHLVIKSDSAYLVDGMTAHIKKWRANGWRTASNAEVKNRDLWTELYMIIDHLYTDTGAAVDFWHVPREQNRDADRLANLGLEKPYSVSILA